MTAYLTLPRLHVQQANIYNAAFLVGGPPVLAAWFMAHALERELNKGAQTKIQMESLAFVHHNMEPLGEFQNGQFSLQQRRGAAYTFDPRNSDYSSKNPHVLSLQPVACAHMEVSLVIGFDLLGNDDIEKITKWLRTGRLAGGFITSMGKPTAFDSLKKALKEGVRTGFLVMERRDLMENGEGNRAEKFVAALGCSPSAGSGMSWLSAACLGYAAITPFEQRAGAREDYLHSFAEPLIGLVQYRSLRNMIQEGASAVKRALWRSDWCAPDVFVIYQDPHPKSNQPKKE